MRLLANINPSCDQFAQQPAAQLPEVHLYKKADHGRKSFKLPLKTRSSPI